MWDGTAMTVIAEYVTDPSANLTYAAANQFSIDSEEALYATGTPVRAQLTAGVYVTALVSAVAQAGDTTTVTLDSGVLTPDLSEVAYSARPPVLAFLYAAHDRLWGFGKGPLQPVAVSADADRSRVFYTFSVNDPSAWHDSGGSLQSINLADKSPVQDELLGMSVKDGMTVFLGRRQTQVWTGSDPTISGDFSWRTTLPLGVVHGEALLELPNDVAFLTDNGMRTLTRSLQTEQLDVSDVGSEMDPTWSEVVQAVRNDTAAYRALRHGRCDAQGWYGLNVPGRTLVLQVTAGGPAWTVFDGLFGQAGAMGSLPDGSFLLAVAGQLYRYDTNAWADDGAAFSCRWWTPWLAPGDPTRRWANYTLNVLTAQAGTLPLTLSRYRDLNDADPKVMALETQSQPDCWDEVDWDVALWDNVTPPPSRVRDHFVCGTMALAVECTTTQGPLTLLGVKLEGVTER
jgi:hypothetical protein